MSIYFKRGVFAQIFAVVFGGMIMFGAGAAQAEGVYGGFSFGKYSAEDLNDSGSAFKVFIGNRINENFAVEGAYVNLGKAKETQNDPFFGELSLESKTTIISISAVGIGPIGSGASFIGKIGLGRWDADLTGCIAVIGCAGESDSGIDFNFGIGFLFDFSKDVALRVEYEKYSAGTDIGGFDAGGGMFSIGLNFKF